MNINFLASLNNKQLTALTELFNGQHVFQPEVDTNTVAALFMCRLKEPLVVCNARTLCYIFHILSEERLITPIWQAVPLSRQTGGGYHAERPFHQFRPLHRAARRGEWKDTGSRSRQLYQKPTDMGSVHHSE